MGNVESSEARETDNVVPEGKAGARHGQVTGVWRVLGISLVLAVAAFAIVSLVFSGG